MKRPVSVTIAVVLQWVAAIVGVVIAFGLIAAAFEMSSPGVAQQLEGALVGQGVIDVPGTAVVQAVFLAGVLLAAIAFVRVIVAVYLAKGRPWARIVVTAFVVVNLLGGLAYFFQGLWGEALGIVVIELIVLGLLFNGKASAFFAAGGRD